MDNNKLTFFKFKKVVNIQIIKILKRFINYFLQNKKYDLTFYQNNIKYK